MKFGVVVFPGTWSDVDCFDVLHDVFGKPVEYIWHKDTDLSPYDCIILPRRGLFLWRLPAPRRDCPLSRPRCKR